MPRRSPAGVVEIEKSGGVWVVTLRGEHDVAVSGDLRAALRGIFAAERAGAPDRAVAVIDLTEARFIDSSVVNALVCAHQAGAGGTGTLAVAVASPRGVPARVLTLCGVTDLIPTFVGREAAVSALRQRASR